MRPEGPARAEVLRRFVITPTRDTAPRCEEVQIGFKSTVKRRHPQTFFAIKTQRANVDESGVALHLLSFLRP